MIRADVDQFPQRNETAVRSIRPGRDDEHLRIGQAENHRGQYDSPHVHVEVGWGVTEGCKLV